jgi:hypothetical protein
VAPGQALAGDSIRVYGRGFTPGKAVTLRAWPASGGAMRWKTTATAREGRFADVRLPVDLEVGRYFLATTLQPQPDTMGTVEVVPREIAIPSERAPRRTPAHVVPGQVVTSSWAFAGDVHFFAVATGRHTGLRILLERVDSSKSPFNPASPDPELLVADPDGLIADGQGYADNRGADDTDAEVPLYVSEKAGHQIIACRSRTAGGAYRLTVTCVALAEPGELAFGPVGGTPMNVVPTGRRVRSSSACSCSTRAACRHRAWASAARTGPRLTSKGSGALLGRFETDMLTGEITGVRMGSSLRCITRI